MIGLPHCGSWTELMTHIEIRRQSSSNEELNLEHVMLMIETR